MAGKVTNAGAGVGKVQPKISSQDRMRLDKQSEILGKLGMNDPNALGDRSRAKLEQLTAGDPAGVRGLDAATAAKDVKKAFAADFAAKFDPGDGPDGSISIPGKYDSVKEEKGQRKLVGDLARPQHPVHQLLVKLEIDPNNLGPNVTKALNANRGRELGSGALRKSANYSKLASNLAHAKVMDSNLGGVGKIAGSGVAIGGAAKLDGPTTAADLGLNKTARTAAQLDARPTESLESTMRSEKVRDPKAAGRRDSTIAMMSKTFGDMGMSESQLESFKPVLDKVLREGQSTAKHQGGKTWAIVRSAEKARTGQAMPPDKGPIGDTALDRAANTSIASFGLFNLAQAHAGGKLDMTRVGELDAPIKAYTKTSAAAGASKSRASANLGGVNFGSGTEEASSAKQASGPARGAKMSPSKAAAHEQLREMGFDPADPNNAHVTRDVESAFAQVMNGAKDDKELAMRGFAWVERQTGDTQGGLSRGAQQVLDAGAADNPEVLGMMKKHAMSTVAQCAIAGPEAFAQHQAQMAGGGGPGMPGGIPGGPGMPGIPPMGGVNPAMGMPYGQAEQAITGNLRVFHGAMILNDPALSHEDKIMLFLMMLCTFNDEDKMRKMREIADADARSMAKDSQKTAMDGAQRESAEQLATAQANPELAAAAAQEAAKNAATTATGKKGPATGARQTGAKTGPAKKGATTGAAKKGATTGANPKSAPPRSASSPAAGAAAKKTAPKRSASSPAATGTASAPPPKDGGGKTAAGGGPPPNGPPGAGPPSGPPGGPTPPGGPENLRPPNPEQVLQNQAQMQAQGTQDPEGVKSKEVLVSEMQRLEKIRDMIFQSLKEIIAQKDRTVKELLRSF